MNRELIKNDNGRPYGFIEQTAGGFYRAYCYETSSGSGPFTTRENAERFAIAGQESANPFCRLADRPFYQSI